MAILLDTLKSVDFLAGTSEDVIVAFMVSGKSRDFGRGHVFWRVEAPPQGIVIPITGEAKSANRSTEGREFIERFVGPGECVGLHSAVDGLVHPTSAEVVRRGEFFTISSDAFQRFLAKYPAVRTKLVEILGRRYRQALQEREDIALRPVSERIAQFLLEHACIRQTDGARVLVDATQAEIAARLGTVREVVARVFADFSHRGLLERTPKGLFVGDWDGLRFAAALPPATSDDDGVYGPGSSVRTARFFLSAGERRRPGISNDPRTCSEHLDDLAECRRKGCPASADRPENK